MSDSVNLKITSCRQCPFMKEGSSYSLDGFDRGNDWLCTKKDRVSAYFIERKDENPPIPGWCPLIPESNG